MSNNTLQLCDFAASLRRVDLPPAVVRRAKDCIADTVGAMIQGGSLPWSRQFVDYAAASGRDGQSTLFGQSAVRLDAAAAALANGALAHAFEMDCLTYPSAGTHPGANLVPAGLAVAQETGASGADFVTAVIAGCEVLNRVGRACGAVRSAFHAPGILGPIGGAVTAAHLLKLDAAGVGNAIGIAASLGSGLMAFSASRDGWMVKKLHLGRSAESGVLAARLAARGVTGPTGVLDGQGGALEAYSAQMNPDELTRDLGLQFETMTISLKRFPTHITAHTPIQALLDLRDIHGFEASDIYSMAVSGSARMVQHNGNREPSDMMMAQYSVPFCLALAAHRDPCQPSSFGEDALQDPGIRDLCRRVVLTEGPASPQFPLRIRLTITLRDSRVLECTTDSYPGTPLQPANQEMLQARFLSSSGNTVRAQELFRRLDNLEEEPDLTFVIDPLAPARHAEAQQ